MDTSQINDNVDKVSSNYAGSYKIMFTCNFLVVFSLFLLIAEHNNKIEQQQQQQLQQTQTKQSFLIYLTSKHTNLKFHNSTSGQLSVTKVTYPMCENQLHCYNYRSL